MLIGLFVTCIVLTLPPHAGKAASQAPAQVGESAHGATRGRHAPGEPREGEPVRPAARSADLYSLRARRRFASYLRLRLLEMREAGLERAADAVERRIPVDDLVP